jgi:hypothetical protein
MSEYSVSFFRGTTEFVAYTESPDEFTHKTVALDALGVLSEIVREEALREIGLAIEAGGHDNSWDYWDYRVEEV